MPTFHKAFKEVGIVPISKHHLHMIGTSHPSPSRGEGEKHRLTGFFYFFLGALAMKIAFALAVDSALTQSEGNGMKFFDRVIFGQGEAIVKTPLNIGNFLEDFKPIG